MVVGGNKYEGVVALVTPSKILAYTQFQSLPWSFTLFSKMLELISCTFL